MAKRRATEHFIQTDMGKTVVKRIPSSAASKPHKCPECESYTDFYESHVLLLPIECPGNRRYMHTECYERLSSKGGIIQLHPGLSYLSSNYLS